MFFADLDPSIQQPHSSAASVITIVAVLFAKETMATSLRHDRVVRGAHD